MLRASPPQHHALLLSTDEPDLGGDARVAGGAARLGAFEELFGNEFQFHRDVALPATDTTTQPPKATKLFRKTRTKVTPTTLAIRFGHDWLRVNTIANGNEKTAIVPSETIKARLIMAPTFTTSTVPSCKRSFGIGGNHTSAAHNAKSAAIAGAQSDSHCHTVRGIVTPGVTDVLECPFSESSDAMRSCLANQSR